jgi:ferredoxin
MKTLKIFLGKSKSAILVSVFVILSVFLISTAATASTNGTASTPELIIDYDLCVKCGWCCVVAPNCFFILGETTYIWSDWYEHYPEWFYAILECPVGAISYTNY